MYGIHLNDDLARNYEYSNFVEPKVYSYTKERYFNSNIVSIPRVTTYPEYSTDIEYSSYDAPSQYRPVTSKIEEILHQYDADLVKCDDILSRYRSNPNSYDSTNDGYEKTVRFAYDNTNHDIRNRNDHEEERKPTVVQSGKEKHDRKTNNIRDAMKSNNSMDEIECCGKSHKKNIKLRLHGQEDKLKYLHTYQTASSDSEKDSNQTDQSVKSYNNIGLLKTILENISKESSSCEIFYENKAIQCETSEDNTNNIKKEKYNNCGTMSDKIRALFSEIYSSSTPPTNTNVICKNSDTSVKEKHKKKIQLDTKCSKKSISKKNSFPKHDKKNTCNNIVQNDRKFKNNTQATKRPSKLLNLICDPQCQKLKSNIEKIHKGLENKEPYYSFCGKVRHRSLLSHPLLDRKSRSVSAKPMSRCHNRTAIIKTVDNTQISIKANTLIINCHKDNYRNVLRKINTIDVANVKGEQLEKNQYNDLSNKC